MKKSTLTLMLGLVLAGVTCIIAWPKLEQSESFKKGNVPMAVQKISHRVEHSQTQTNEPVQLDDKVKSRLAEAGFKTDSFNAVRTKGR